MQPVPVGRWIAPVEQPRVIEAVVAARHELRRQHSELAFVGGEDRVVGTVRFERRRGHVRFQVVRLGPQEALLQRLDGPVHHREGDPAADWHGLHPAAELPNTIDPSNGWAFNSNDWLYSAAGPNSPKAANYPAYLDTAGESYRTVHATRLLRAPRRWTLDRLHTAAFVSALPSFEVLVPMLGSAWQSLPASDPRRARMAEPIAALAAWDKRWGAASVPNTLAQFWGDEIVRSVAAHRWTVHANSFRHMERLSADEKLDAFGRALDRLQAQWGGWRVPWGEINRFQRISSLIDP